LPDKEIGLLTMREVHALAERYNNEQESLNKRTALICAVLANINRDPKRNPTPFTVDDFMPTKQEKEQTPEQMADMARMINTLYGGKEVEI